MAHSCHHPAPTIHPATLPLQLHEIEKQQHKEAVKQLRRWDERFSLRTKPLAELRALAQ